MASLTQAITLAADTAFQRKVAVAMCRFAETVMELSDAQITTQVAGRRTPEGVRQLAASVLATAARDEQQRLWALIVVSAETFEQNPTDAQISTRVLDAFRDLVSADSVTHPS